MHDQDPITLTRDCEATLIPAGDKVTLNAGEVAYITQSLGGSYTVMVNGNLFRIAGQDADALGKEVEKSTIKVGSDDLPATLEAIQKEVWNQIRTCYDPEIPVNIVDLGLIYGCEILPAEDGDGYRAEIKMTLTAPGCGMGEHLRQDVFNKVSSIEEISDVDVELVWDPPWGQDKMTEAARLQLGLM